MAVKLNVKINVDGVDNTKEPFEKAKKNATSLASGVTAASTAYLALSDAIGRVANLMAAPIRAALDAERANYRLTNSLARIGDSSGASATAIREFASQMQYAAGMEDNLISSVTAGNAEILKSADNAMALTQSSIALAKARGIDLVQANDALLASFNGEAGALKSLVPGINNLTQAQLKTGEAARLVSRVFGDEITGDFDTAFGQIERARLGFDSLVGSIGDGILEGIKSSGVFRELAESLGLTGDTVEAQKEAFKEFGKYIGENLIKALELMKDSVDLLAPSLTIVNKTIERISAGLDLMGSMIMTVVYASKTLYIETKALLDAGNRRVNEVAKMKEVYASYTDELNRNRKAQLDNAESIGKSFKLFMFGMKDAEDSRKDFFSSLPQVKEREFKNPRLPADKKNGDALLSLQRSIADQTLAIENETSNSVIAELESRTAKVKDIQEDAARKGFNVTADVAKLMTAIWSSYYRKLDDMRMADAAMIAKASGRTTDAINLDLSNQLNEYQKMLAQKRISDIEYMEASAEAVRRANEANSMTTGSQSLDEGLDKGTAFLGAVQGGIASIVSSIGSMFGPMGNLIASIINLLNMSREQFTLMLDGLIDAFSNLMPNIISSFGVIIEKIPEMLNAFWGQLFSVGFWTRAVKSLWTALVNMFKNFWAMLFGGKSITEQANRASPKTVNFGGTNNPNAGDDQFKIKDATGEVRQAKEFEDSFSNTVEESGKTFVSYLQDFFKSIFGFLGDFFVSVWDAVKGVVSSIWEAVSALGSTIWNMVTKAFTWAYNEVLVKFYNLMTSVFSWVYREVFVAAYNLMTKAFSWVYTEVFVKVYDLIVGVFQWVYRSITDAFMWVWNNIFKPFVDLFAGIADAVSGSGGQTKNIWNPTKWKLNEGGNVSYGMSNSGLAQHMKSRGAMAFADGGMVPGFGVTDTVPAVLTPGERVLNRDEAAAYNSGAGNSVSISINIHPTAKVDRAAVDAMTPMLIEVLRKESGNGTRILNNKGVYK